MPSGYVRHPSGEVTFDPDEQVQQVIRLIFYQFEELGTLNAVLRYLVKHDIQLGIRVRTGANKGELEWRRPAADDLADSVEASNLRASLMFTVVVKSTLVNSNPDVPAQVG